MYIVYKYIYIYIYLFIFLLLLLRHALHMRKKDEEMMKKDEEIKSLQRQKQDVWRGWRVWILEAERRGCFVRENKGPVFSNSFLLDDSDENRTPMYDPDDFDDSDESGSPLKDL